MPSVWWKPLAAHDHFRSLSDTVGEVTATWNAGSGGWEPRAMVGPENGDFTPFSIGRPDGEVWLFLRSVAIGLILCDRSVLLGR